MHDEEKKEIFGCEKKKERDSERRGQRRRGQMLLCMK
jgi:hypothetical protein